MTATEYLKENSDWFDKSPGGEKLYFESEVVKMMENYSSKQEISDEEIQSEAIKRSSKYKDSGLFENTWEEAIEWYKEQLQSLK